MLHYNPRHVSSSAMLILRRTNCIITASGIVTLCKRPYSMPVESGLGSKVKFTLFHSDVFLTVHHSIDLFQITNLMHNSFIL